MKKSTNKLYLYASATVFFGSGLALIGHGILAAQQDPSLVLLFGQSLRQFGIALYDSTVASFTQYTGIFDILIGLLLLLVGACLFARNTTIHRFATSWPAYTLLSWAVGWQIFTSAAVMVANLEIFPGAWVFLERSPSFLLPLAGIFLLKAARKK